MNFSNKFKRAKSGLLAGALAAGFLFGAQGAAQAYLFDADGAGGQAPQEIANLDWGPTSFLAVGGVTAIGAFTTPGSTSFDVVTMSKLTAANDTNNNNLLPSGFFGGSPTMEITMVTRFTETVQSVSGNQATFKVDTSKPVYLEIYFDTTPNSVPLSGSGFNDGRLILKATALLNSTGTFTVTLDNGSPVTGALDQSGTNNYTGQNTVAGTGDQGDLSFGGLTVDPTFFTQALASFGLNFNNVSINLPFKQVDPSDCFTLYAANTGSGTAVGSNTGAEGTLQCQPGHVDGLMSANNDASLNGGYLPNIGSVNGGFPVGGVPGTDFMAQTDFNSSLVSAVPEPASFLLFGFGLLGMGGYLRNRSRKNK